MKSNAITVIEDGVVLYLGYDREAAWQIYMNADGRDITYYDPLTGECQKKDYIIVQNKWSEVIFRDNRKAYEYIKEYGLNNTFVRVFRFTRDSYNNTKFRTDVYWVKNFYIRNDGGCFPNQTALNQCRININDTTSQF